MGDLKKISRWVGLSFCIVSAATAISACSQSSPTGSTSAANTIANSPLGDRYNGPPTPCDGDLSVKDAADLINGETSVNHYSMLAAIHAPATVAGS